MSERAHYHGHRERLRERFRKGGPDSLHDYELLELVLFQAKPRGDVKPLAKDLLKTFGSFAAVVSADRNRLLEVPGVGPSTVDVLKVIQAASHAFMRDQLVKGPVIGSWQALLEYCQASMGYNREEQFRILFLDRKNQLIADEVQQTGTVDHTPVYPREVVKRALDLGASAIIMVHNHPSGDPTPSKADIQITRDVRDAVKAVDIALHDHLVVCRDSHASFKSLGYL